LIKEVILMPFRSEPLPASFTILSLLGFVAALLYWNSGKLSPPWGFTLALFFVIVFVGSLISMRESVEIEHKIRKAKGTSAKRPKKRKKAKKRRKKRR
jgi:hypothetical protein